MTPTCHDAPSAATPHAPYAGVHVFLTAGLEKKEGANFKAMAQLVTESGGQLVPNAAALRRLLPSSDAPAAGGGAGGDAAGGGGGGGGASRRKRARDGAEAEAAAGGGGGEAVQVLVVGVAEDNTRRSGLPPGLAVWSREALVGSVLRSRREWGQGAGGAKPLFLVRGE